MDFVRSYKLEKNDNGYTLILYLDMGMTEFADEFGSIKDESINNRDKLIRDIVNKFPSIKINSIKLMVGTLVVATITFPPLDGMKPGLSASPKASFNMTYSYFETGNPLMKTLEKTGDILDVVSPGYFDITPDGNLKITSQLDPYTIKQMQKQGLRVVPFLANHWDKETGRAALRNKKLLISQLANIIKQYNLDGVNVDIENLDVYDRDEFTLFVKELREALPRDKEVSVAVAANPRGYTQGYYGSFDYTRLAEYADYLMIMSYDEHYNGGNPGPVSSIQFVEESIKYALKHAPPSKIVIGMPFYGRYWSKDGKIKGNGTNLIRINELIRKYNGSVSFDKKFKSPVATVNITGYEKDMPQGIYNIWYENEESILNKLNLIEKYNLKGAGSWSLHQATQNIWDVYNQWSNSSRIFVDVSEGWAKAPIISVSEKGWMIGTRDFYFEPNNPLTRAQAASLIVRLLELGNSGVASPYFRDVSSNHWAYNDIQITAQHGLMSGKGNQIFDPDEYMTREEMATLLSRLLNIAPSPNKINLFKDVDTNRWSYPYIMAMTEKNIFVGFEDNTFKPMDKITRAQMASLLDRIKYMIPPVR